VKVDNLLGPYLYLHKRLSLPGIGLFVLDDNAVLPDDSVKIKMQIEGISFNAKTGNTLDDSLIQYIKDQTGKMKALAEADLYSFIATGLQFLNIGKPFYFEGIGTLQKNKDNEYSFTAGTMIPQKIEEMPARFHEGVKKSSYNTDSSTSGIGSKKLSVVLAILLTLVIIGWGGYYLYKKNSSSSAEVSQTEAKTPSAATGITDTTGKKPDSIILKDNAAATAAVKKDSVAAAPGNYKFILETTSKKIRALTRYEQLRGITMLKNYNNKVALETKDSLSFNLYTIVPCAAADTAHVKELLNAWYYGTKQMKVKIDR
jgi:hypothetical protein